MDYSSSRAKEIIDDFHARENLRRSRDEQWLLNINFLNGKQNVYVAHSGEIREEEKLYPYESKEVFNHIAPIIESRLAKLGKVRPMVAVRPTTSSEKDKMVAKTTKNVITSEFDRINISKLIKDATLWSEVTGTAFYKIMEENGEVKVSVLSPFEVFPESEDYMEIEDNPSIIIAKNVSVSEAESYYGISGLAGEKLGFVSFATSTLNPVQIKDNQVTVIERYEKPTIEFPNGRLEIVVGDQLVLTTDMKEYPIVKQVSNLSIQNFWGKSVIERCIPVQRAYNAVKNRKIEYLSRLTAGVLAVEEGSVDLDLLETDGLAPGKILVYRAGSSSPKFMDGFSVPTELNREEDRLLGELNTLAGVSDLMRSSVVPASITSGTAINQLTEADDTRLSVSAEFIREAVLKIAKIMLKIIKSMNNSQCMSRLFDDDGAVEVFYWNASDLKSEDLILDTVNELSESISSRRGSAMELYKAGLFFDDNGKMDGKVKSKILDILGFGSFESGQRIVDLHIKRAKKENLSESIPMVYEFDDHAVHIDEHVRFLVENDETPQQKIDQMIEHIRTHKMFMGEKK